ncbi:MAG: hypothetical protein E7476_16405 [Ruminococcaceae bacterium]|nr:hypothetical protein [Oscillospiraceae bacterium]
MASSNSTANLHLNQWLGSDKPKMEDFNSDNRKLDEAVGAHLADEERHIRAEERLSWNAGIPVVGTYTGDGQSSQRITLGFRPSFGMVFAIDQAVVRVSGSNVILFTAFLGPNGASIGVSANDTGFDAYYAPTAIGGRITNMNVADVVYQYILFR